MRSTSRNIICEKQPFGGGRRAVFLCAGMGSFVPPGASSFLSSLKESYQRKPLEATFQDFLARECAGVAPAGASLRRPHFFLRRKKCGKESRLDLRSKDPLARCGSCRFGGMHSRMKCGGGRCRFGGSLVPLAPLPLTTARVGAGTLVVFGDYQIAPIAARSTAMGRWRLTPPGYGGTCLPAGPSRGRLWGMAVGAKNACRG